jgi:hypothetical protein
MYSRRQAVNHLLSLILVLPITACDAQNSQKQGRKMKDSVVMNVVMFNYTDRSLFEVLLNGHIDHGSPPFGGGGGVNVGVTISLGPQTLTWRLGGPKGTPRNGETVTAKNQITLTREQIPATARYMAIHIYPDETAELTFAEGLPDTTLRGQKIYDEEERKNAK